MGHPHDDEKTPPQHDRRALLGLAKVSAFVLIQAILLFLAAGDIGWTAGWAYIGITIIPAIVAALIMERSLIAERAGIGPGAKGWDVPLALLMGRIGPLTTVIVAGLDHRFAWSASIAPGVRIAALCVGVLSVALTDWAVVANPFFSGVVRIQRDRGHHTVTAGPYAAIRHPGYAGAIIFALVSPLMLESLWALIPGGLQTLVAVVRTALEDRTLQTELEGYSEYSDRVRYRLVPGIW